MGKVLKVREVGDPILEKECEEVDIKNINKDILDIIEDLKSTLEFGTGLGIAAPQIGINKRIIVVGAKKENIKYNDAEEIPITAMINPTWKKLSEDTDVQYEGCMSVPTIRGKVERYKNIELTYYNENGDQIMKQIHGFFARLVQHECDHLDGIVFLEKVKEHNGFATVDNINKYNLRQIKLQVSVENIKIRKCTANDVDDIYNIQNIVIDNFKEEEKGYFLPFSKDTYLRIVNDPINDGEMYGAFIDNKMVAWIFLSVSNRMKELKQMIPNMKGNCADIDGVIVLPEYRGYGLQKTLVKYLEEKAKEKGINNIIAEVTFGNVYSLRNLKDLGYEEKTWYEKDENIKRYILLKKLGETENE